jgi:hypothetical protein
MLDMVREDMFWSHGTMGTCSDVMLTDTMY